MIIILNGKVHIEEIIEVNIKNTFYVSQITQMELIQYKLTNISIILIIYILIIYSLMDFVDNLLKFMRIFLFLMHFLMLLLENFHVLHLKNQI